METLKWQWGKIDVMGKRTNWESKFIELNAEAAKDLEDSHYDWDKNAPILSAI